MLAQCTHVQPHTNAPVTMACLQTIRPHKWTHSFRYLVNCLQRLLGISHIQWSDEATESVQVQHFQHQHFCPSKAQFLRELLCLETALHKHRWYKASSYNFSKTQVNGNKMVHVQCRKKLEEGHHRRSCPWQNLNHMGTSQIFLRKLSYFLHATWIR